MIAAILFVIATARVSVAIGANVGLEEEPHLHFANADAKAIDSVMRDLGGVSSRNAYVLRDADPIAIWALLERVTQRVRELGPATELFFYFSGHGDDQTLHAGGARVDRARVEKTLRSAAQRVVMIVDACRTGNTSLHAVDGPAALSSPTVSEGFVEIQSAAVDEPAQESRALGGAIFTHYWVTGLRGAADSSGDGNVTLEEAYRFAHAGTVAQPPSRSQPVIEPLPEDVITQIVKNSSRPKVK